MPNGVRADAWTPEGRGRDFRLSPILEPLEDLKSEILVPTNLWNQASDFGDGHYVKTSGFLTCTTITKSLGFDVAVHTATKYLGGHSDVVAGAVISSRDRMEQIFHRAFLLNGGILGPWDAWLILRGLRTLPARLRELVELGPRSRVLPPGAAADLPFPEIEPEWALPPLG